MAKTQDESGRFQQLSDQKRKVRSVRLTDRTWDKLSELASKNDQTIADFLEQNVANFPENCNAESNAESPKLSATDALDSAQSILQSKKAAKRSMERLLSAIYGIDLRLN